MRRLTALSLALLAGCSPLATDSGVGDSGPSPDGGGRDGGAPADAGPVGLPFAGACQALNAARCGYLVRCELLASRGSLSDCEGFLDATWCNDGDGGPVALPGATWPSRVAAGTLSYDPLVAEACAQSFETQACADYAVPPVACQSFLKPAVLLGGDCYGAPFAECQVGVCRGAACPYQCSPLGELADSCEEDLDCDADAGLYCHYNGPLAVSQCTAPSTAGTSCDDFTRCATNLVCASGQCTTLRLIGQACRDPGTCAAGAWCAPTSPDGGKCVLRLDAGAPCQLDEACPEGDLCLMALGECAPAVLTEAGAPCFPEQTCPAGSTCVHAWGADAGTCGTPVALGGTCYSSLDCEADLACAPSGMCAVREADQQPCVLDRDCWLGSACINQVCASLPRPGQSCSSVCLYGSCAPDAGVCQGLSAAGSACARDVDCASDRCLAAACVPACGP